MLLVVNNYAYDRIYVANIEDNSYEAISKALEKIGHPEFFADGLKENRNAELGEIFYIYNWDDIATAMAENHCQSIFDVDLKFVECIGELFVVNTYIAISNGSLED